MTTKVYKALSIAGSDSGGGAGIQADLKTFQELGAYGMTVITAITAQNTLGVHGVYPVDIDAVGRQLDAIGEDLPPDAVKTGMLFSSDVIRLVAAKTGQYGWRNLVIDPVMVAKGGSALLRQDAIRTLVKELIPLALVTTPNIPEAELLTGMAIRSMSDREEAAKRIVGMGSRYAVIKGGHDAENGDRVIDLVYDGSRFDYMESDRIDTRHTHGTGCTYSAALAAELAAGKTAPEAIATAKRFIHAAIGHALGIGGGHGPTNHFAYRRQRLAGGTEVAFAPAAE
ncbi:bifunctional hydroxymethylpyrimidine kinase/phosphomethylpyrimidine kinase [Paenibacillus arenilitoris]|uniref:Hydroxymethylpyrimidine/phosphomethylpyrimidine kinase n=1 Tax=Paenibacillus arenilitoris TaxID=2772299 RepID=A0A927CKU2_9BACL|nr:bifunctional hydroxymethylpyrimidine kinase/phosphomethylpyrimidine kinase [Paenibacillus arenilitoris]MBD2867505.1 bifunctional hydroxymethylpyrimidine kinase/phosphomethylpyrimidine kinase [Paenibacillus arenilitoris]